MMPTAKWRTMQCCDGEGVNKCGGISPHSPHTPDPHQQKLFSWSLIEFIFRDKCEATQMVCILHRYTIITQTPLWFYREFVLHPRRIVPRLSSTDRFLKTCVYSSLYLSHLLSLVFGYQSPQHVITGHVCLQCGRYLDRPAFGACNWMQPRDVK